MPHIRNRVSITVNHRSENGEEEDLVTITGQISTSISHDTKAIVLEPGDVIEPSVSSIIPSTMAAASVRIPMMRCATIFST